MLGKDPQTLFECIREAARNAAKHPQAVSKIERAWFAHGVAEPWYDDVPSAFADWNAVTQWDPASRRFITLDDTPERFAQAVERAGIRVKWDDEWDTCVECLRAIRISADSYSWLPYYWSSPHGPVCFDCVDPEEYLQDLEGDPSRAVTWDALDPTEHGYVRIEADLEAGLHPGQNADPNKIAEALELMGITRYLFKLDSVGQFDATFSVYVHEDDFEYFDPELYETADKETPWARNMMRALEEAIKALKQMRAEGAEGIEYAKINPDGTFEAKIITSQQFVEGEF